MKRYIVPGGRVSVVLPFSEVCMHMRVADQRRTVELTPQGMAQILNDDGTPFSFPVTAGEAGISRDAGGFYVTAPDLTRSA